MKIFFFILKKLIIVIERKKKNYISYQINEIKVKTLGRSVRLENDNEKFNNILIWHFIWSKFYFSKKRYGKFLSILIFIPLIFRINFRILIYKILRKKNLIKKYQFRLDGLLKSIQGEKSFLRP